MISLKKLLDQPSDREARSEAVARFTALLLQGLEESAIDCDPTEIQHFRTDIHGIAEKLEAETLPKEIGGLADAVVNALRQYNCIVTEFINQQRFEYQSMLAMLTDTLASLSINSDQTIAKLHGLEEQLDRAGYIEDIQQVRLQLATFLLELKSESARQKEQATNAINAVNLRLAQAQRPAEAVDSETRLVDELTGLATKPAAEHEIASGVQSTANIYAVLFIVDRVQLATGRFGAEVGDALILTFVRHLAEKLPKQDRLFRWGAASLLVLMERTPDFANVSAEIRRVLGSRLEKTFDIGRRSVLMAVTSSWTAIPLFGASSADDVIRKLESFESKGGAAG